MFLADFPEKFKFELVGSVAINGDGKDIDYAILVGEEGPDDIVQHLLANGFEANNHGYEGVNGEDDKFTSYKRGITNILVCTTIQAYNRFVKGAEICKYLRGLGVNMRDKRVRVAIHSMVSHGNMEQVIKDVGRVRD